MDNTHSSKPAMSEPINLAIIQYILLISYLVLLHNKSDRDKLLFWKPLTSALIVWNGRILIHTVSMSFICQEQ